MEPARVRSGELPSGSAPRVYLAITSALFWFSLIVFGVFAVIELHQNNYLDELSLEIGFYAGPGFLWLLWVVGYLMMSFRRDRRVLVHHSPNAVLHTILPMIVGFVLLAGTAAMFAYYFIRHGHGHDPSFGTTDFKYLQHVYILLVVVATMSVPKLGSVPLYHFFTRDDMMGAAPQETYLERQEREWRRD